MFDKRVDRPTRTAFTFFVRKLPRIYFTFIFLVWNADLRALRPVPFEYTGEVMKGPGEYKGGREGGRGGRVRLPSLARSPGPADAAPDVR